MKKLAIGAFIIIGVLVLSGVAMVGLLALIVVVALLALPAGMLLAAQELWPSVRRDGASTAGGRKWRSPSQWLADFQETRRIRAAFVREQESVRA